MRAAAAMQLALDRDALIEAASAEAKQAVQAVSAFRDHALPPPGWASAGASAARVVGEGEVLETSDIAALCRVQGNVLKKALYAAVNEDMDPVRREVQAERIDLNRDALNGALERALESPTLVNAFSRSGYEPDGLRQMARDGAWDGEVADAIYIVRSGLNRHEVAREAGANVPLGGALAATPEDRLAGEATAAPERQPEQEPHDILRF